MPCLGESTIAEWVDGRLSALRLEQATAHVDDCVACRRLVSAAARAERPSEPLGDDHRETRPTRYERPRPHAGAANAQGARIVIPTFAPGAMVAGRYRITRMIGAGGMGEVYAAVDSELQGEVALKTIAPEHASEPHLVARLKREIQLARRITHRNVCRIFDLGLHRHAAAETVFLTMELLKGETLAARLKRSGPLGVDDALPIVEDMVAGLAAAHEVGVVHRDFKSANVMLVPSGQGCRAVVIDFGLARASEGDAFAAVATARDAIAGSAPYIAPEQLEGRRADAPADIYALGVVLFEMVTGHLPFSGDTPTDMAMRRLREPPRRPSVHVQGLSSAWEATILRCLEREPARRFADVADVVAALDRDETTAPPIAERLPGTRWPMRWRYALVVASAGLVGLLLAGLAKRVGHERATSVSPPAPTPQARAPRAFVLMPLADLVNPDDPWRSVAAGELVRAVLTGEGSTLVIGGDELAGVPPGNATGAQAPRRAARRFAGTQVVTGSLRPVGNDAIEVELTPPEASVPMVRERGPEAELVTVVLRAASRLRAALGLDPFDAQRARTALPEAAQAMRWYAQGLLRLRSFDEAGARDLLGRAAEAAPQHARAHAALAAAIYTLGDYGHAQLEAERAVAAAAALPEPDRLSVEALALASARRWDEAARRLRTLHARSPDDVAVGAALAYAEWAHGDAPAGFRALAELSRRPRPWGDAPTIAAVEAHLALATSDWARARAAATRAADGAIALEDYGLAATARRLQSTTLLHLGDAAAALSTAAEALAMAERAGQPDEQIDSLLAIGVAHAHKGELSDAERRFDEALRRASTRGSLVRVRRSLDNLAIVANWQGRRRVAAHLRRRSAEVAAVAGDADGERSAWRQAAQGFDDVGALRDADAAWSRVVELARAAADSEGEAEALAQRASVGLRQGRIEDARRLAEASLAQAHHARAVVVQAAALEVLGGIELERGESTLARKRLDECVAIAAAVSASHGRCLAALSRLLVAVDDLPAAIARARQAGELGRVALAEALLAAGDLDGAARAVGGAFTGDRDRRLAALLIARLRLQQSRLEEARVAVTRAIDGLQDQDDLLLTSAAALVQARLAAAAPGATGRLTALAEQAAHKRLRYLGWQIALVQGLIDRADVRARQRLQSLQQEASNAGYRGIARQIAAALR